MPVVNHIGLTWYSTVESDRIDFTSVWAAATGTDIINWRVSRLSNPTGCPVGPLGSERIPWRSGETPWRDYNGVSWNPLVAGEFLAAWGGDGRYIPPPYGLGSSYGDCISYVFTAFFSAR